MQRHCINAVECQEFQDEKSQVLTKKIKCVVLLKFIHKSYAKKCSYQLGCDKN